MRSSQQRGFTLIELLVVIAIIAILAAILFPVFSKAREKARQTQCINNQKQFATAMMIYTQENEETMPESQTFWSAIDVPAKVMKCPTAGKNVTNAYVYNNAISGLGLGEIGYPVETLLTADGQGKAADDNSGTADVNEKRYANVAYGLKNFDLRRHGSFVIASYVDGHVGMTYEPRALVKIPLWDLDTMPPYVANSPWPWSANYTAELVTEAGVPAQGKGCLKANYTNEKVDLFINNPTVGFKKSEYSGECAVHVVSVKLKAPNTPFPSYVSLSGWEGSGGESYHMPVYDVNGRSTITSSSWQEFSTVDINDSSNPNRTNWIEGQNNAIIDNGFTPYGFQSWGINDGTSNQDSLNPAAALYLDDVCAWAEGPRAKVYNE